MEEHLTKKERKEQSKLERLSKMEEKSNGSRKKGIIIAGVALLFLLFFGYSIYATKATHDKKLSTTVKLSSSGWVTGNPKSKVTLTEFGDLQCPACLAFEPIMSQVRTDYGKTIKIVYKQFPLPKNVHPNAFAAAVSAEAAGKQGKFWEYHDLVYKKQTEWSSLADPTASFVSYAKTLKLDLDQFKKDIESGELKDRVNTQVDEGVKIGVNSTPTLYINGRMIDIPNNYEELKPQIDDAIKNSQSLKSK